MCLSIYTIAVGVGMQRAASVARMCRNTCKPALNVNRIHSQQDTLAMLCAIVDWPRLCD